MRVFITGGTGLIGSRLIRRLRDRHDEVVLLTRRPEFARQQFGDEVTIVNDGPTERGARPGPLAGCDAIVNLMGEPIFGRRWNAKVKVLLRESRVATTEALVRALGERSEDRPKILVNASAIGYYGPHGDEELEEDSSAGDDFLAGVCVEWEEAARKAEALGVRVALVRFGVVLDSTGGALRQMLTPFKLGLGGPVGSGKQWLSWAHHADAVGILLLALDQSRALGPVNATAPHPVTNKEFSRALGRALHRPSFFPVPGFALRLRFGQVAELLTTGQRVLPRKALELGYRFQFPTIDQALADIFKS
jgi:uncharacterized protein (TIGR01777 family)